MKKFTHKTALVTGAETGVGEGIAQELFDQGATVIMTSRNLAEVSTAAQKIDPSAEKVIPMQLDVKEHLAVKKLMEIIFNRFGALHFLINNAGITGSHGVCICDYDVDEWQDVINTDLGGVFYGMKYAIPFMLKSGGGAIVNLSAVNGVVGIAGLAPYTTAKHGVIGLTKSVALEYAEQGIRVNAIGPGYVETPRIHSLPEEVRAFMANTHPMKRMATREEVAKTVAFLLSDDSSFTTGAFYPIDGGYSAQ